MGQTKERLPLLQEAELMDKVVLVRVDHNVVKKGRIKDPYRIEATLPTLYRIAEQGGRPILMTHVGRPRDKKTGKITADAHATVQPIIDYLKRKLGVDFALPRLEQEGEDGIREIGDSIRPLIQDLKARRIAGIYLPNTRCFRGEEGEGEDRERFAAGLSAVSNLYVNDAFGSWQPHVSTYDIAAILPSYAGILMQKELSNLERVLDPERPFLAVVAGSKYDTKIGPLRKLYERVDHMVLGGVVYNAYLCAKYDIRVAGVSGEDVEAARELVRRDAEEGKIIEPSMVVESDSVERRDESGIRTRKVEDFRSGDEYGWFLDIAEGAYEQPALRDAIGSARTIFVNAVMGLVPLFTEGTRGLNAAVSKNTGALKLYGGGDTLQELRESTPRLYLAAVDDPSYYFFTGGGTVLTAIEQGSPYGLKPVQALMNKTH
ncbi:MAG: phosphoglycerate kinase [Desulfobacteraceae bacterium]